MTDWHRSPFLRPLPAPGLYFRRSSISLWAKLPKRARLYGASYYATEDTHQAGAMCHVIAEMDADRRLHVTDVWHRRTTLKEAAVMLRRLHEGHCRVLEIKAPLTQRQPPPGPLSIFTDILQLERAVSVVLADVQRLEYQEWAKGGRVIAHRPTDPPVRPLKLPFEMLPAARRLQSMLASGSLLLPKTSPWTRDMLAELALWPAVASEAQVGALAVLVAGLSDMAGPQKRSWAMADREGVSGWAA